MNDLTLSTTGQQKIAMALTRLFQGKDLRYIRKDDGTILIAAKDLVEAAGGIWDPHSFNRSLEGGGLVAHPFETTGGRQELLVVDHKMAVMWLSRSRLPSAKELSTIVWEIIGDVMDGKEVNTPIETKQLPPTPEVMAAYELEGTWGPLQRILGGLGFSKGALKASMLETAVRVEAKYNVTLIPDEIRPKLISGQSESASKTAKYIHAAEVNSLPDAVKVTTLATAYGVKPCVINEALIRLGWQYKAGSVYMPHPDGKKYCGASTRTRGPFANQNVITGWSESRVAVHLQREIIKMRNEGLIK